MQRIMLKSKLHRARVTDACLHYEGSIGIDAYLLKEADILEGEQVHIYNLNNGKRFETYTIAEEPHSGKIVLNGAAARLVEPGDLIIIVTYVIMDEAEYKDFSPRKIMLDHNNQIIKQG